jgi:translation elongation factor EF-Ts
MTTEDLVTKLRENIGASPSDCRLALRLSHNDYRGAFNLLESRSFDKDIILLLLERIEALEAAP